MVTWAVSRDGLRQSLREPAAPHFGDMIVYEDGSGGRAVCGLVTARGRHNSETGALSLPPGPGAG